MSLSVFQVLPDPLTTPSSLPAAAWFVWPQCILLTFVSVIH